MESIVKLYSDKIGEISRFLNKFTNEISAKLSNDLEWSNTYKNPTEIADIIGTFIENNDNFDINMWISIDENVFINITENNADEIIRYLYERFPY